MLNYYKTVQTYGTAEVIIRKSRFISHAKPVQSEEEAVQFIDSIKKQHGMATHNCSAYRVGERDEFQKQSDDGEPSGTAGRPILEVIKHQELQNIAIVVTRYFGGIMLGAGGLVRAYTDAAVAGISSSRVIYQVLHQEVRVEVDYTWLGKLENELRNREIYMGEAEFTDKVVLHCLPLFSGAAAFIHWMTDLTQGQGNITIVGLQYIEHDHFSET